MRVAAATNLACPIDSLPLVPRERQLVCPRGHSFDRARDGYWNLLVVQHKASLDPGDSKDMVAARRRFLGAGHYAPIAEKVFGLVRAHALAQPGLMIADAGCGEGYYLDRVAELARADGATAQLSLAGYDVSKWAVQAAAKRAGTDGSIAWAVANSSHPPLTPGSVDFILCLFGFPIWESFRTLQSAPGSVLMIDPGPDHLLELRALIYPDVRKSPAQSLAAAESHGYRLQHEDVVTFRISLTSQAEIQDLLAMTPHAHRMPEAGRAAIAATHALDVTVNVVARLLRLT